MPRETNFIKEQKCFKLGIAFIKRCEGDIFFFANSWNEMCEINSKKNCIFPPSSSKINRKINGNCVRLKEINKIQ